MTLYQVIFYFFAALAVGSAVSVITVQNPVRSVLSLVITFFAMAGIWMLLHAEFLSLVLLLVYVGAVMTLFLFVVMMLNVNREQASAGFVRYWPFASILLFILVVLLFMSAGGSLFGLDAMPAPQAVPENYSNLKVLGSALFTHFVYPFEIAGVILLAAIVAAISLTHRTPLRGRRQDIDAQVSVRPEDRLRLIKMDKQGNPI
ncbi:MAG TPA: NADH-quinone oxidoreductase subunit J [Gammaproteobacteria bacterium]|jgi:NADH-quinone oxidoreductase subunit J|nr:NADH-quinone oxidoreductase subunit J [Gammaproteobacteria bacterium]